MSFVTTRNRDSRHLAVRDTATARAAVTADQDAAGRRKYSSAHQALPNRAHGALPPHHQM